MPRSRPVDLSAALLTELSATAGALADAAAPETMRHFRTRLDADNKLTGGFDPVTEGDRAAERAMRDALARLRPDDAIFGEEYGTSSGTTGLTWVLDPIDGTRAYLAGAPTWGTLIAVSDEHGPILGIIDQPHIGERFEGGPSGAALTDCRGRSEIAVRADRSLDEAILLTTFPEIGSPDQRAAFERVSARAKLTRYGLDCYAYALLALGQVDLVIEAGLAPYDIQGPMAVVEAAGGIVTTWQGGLAHEGGAVIAACGPKLHVEALALLAG